jgi:ribosomal protein S27AE
MEHTEDLKAEVRRQFSTRRRRQLVAAVPLAVMAVASALADRQAGAVFGIDLQTAAPFAAIYVIGLVAFTFKNWRCPACDRSLGRSVTPRFCARCGAQLSS